MNLPSSSNESSDESIQPYTPSEENYQALISIITNEVSCPEILPYTNYIDAVLNFAKNLPQNPQNQFNSNRIVQLLSIYINARIEKIERLALFYQQNLSSNEKILAEQIGRVQQTVMKDVLSNIQERVSFDMHSFVEEDFINAKSQILEIINKFKVFCRFLEPGHIDDDIIQQGVQRLIEYGKIRDKLINGQCVIIGFADPWN
ncbi:hypothetical protein SS50377_23327 [Spironucleus salmonicida]|uniref:Uncharacterized protein n=1 Tax=Spironucleus salmonicida TaxID=348837 RepID=V6LRC6_9EUKA|nr:hypothetical protein SS50377_23327 [Spironucleus salmonicida]|eukprot:EST47197.1 Hypothetical protein SS50377_12707 [Spironucleus salmonicida]